MPLYVDDRSINNVGTDGVNISDDSRELAFLDGQYAA